MRRVVAIGALTAMLLGGMPSAGATDAARTGLAPSQGFASTRGNRFVAADGRPLLLKGINLGNWLVPEGYMLDFEVAKSPHAIYAATEGLLGRDGSVAFWRQFRENFIREDDINFIASAGFNTVRVPLHYAMFEGNGGVHAPTEGYTLLDRLITWCKAAGLYVVLDMHAAPGGQTGVNHDDGSGYPLLFYVPALQDRTIAIWRAIAEHYRDEPTILGYDLLNEPIAPYHDIAHLNPKLEPLYRRLVAEIRAVDSNHVIFLGGAQWNSNFSVFGPPFDRNLAYTYHSFWAPPTRASLREYLNFSYLFDVPIWLGESGEADDAWIQAFRTLHERHAISWCFWTYKNMTSPATVVAVSRPRNWEYVVAVADQRQSEGVAANADPPRQAAAAALAEYLENVKLEHTTIQRGYLQALGLRVPE